MKDRPYSFPSKVAGFTLADGDTWGIVAGDERAAGIVACLAEAMRLCLHETTTYRLLVLTEDNGSSLHLTPFAHASLEPIRRSFSPLGEDKTITCIVSPTLDNDMMANQLIQLSLIIARQAQNMSGILLHGALMERDGRGVLLAGPGGVGKTTASRRLRAPWRSLSDDETLVVRGKNGAYWAHPWPTWSSFMAGGNGGTWDVNHAVLLKAIFFLAQARYDHIEPIGAGHAVPLLVELAEQTSWLMSARLHRFEERALRLQRFENICSLAKSMSCYRLHLSLDGAFWKEIERVIVEEEKEAS